MARCSLRGQRLYCHDVALAHPPARCRPQSHLGHQFHGRRQRPVIKQAAKTFRGRIINALLGCAVGLTFLVLGGSREWKLPLALAVTVLLSTYVVRVQVMWRQAPITAAIVIAAGMTHHSELTALEIGVRRVGEVLLGCVMGLVVSWLMSKLWPVPEGDKSHTAHKQPA